eukprot:CAMPEP_0168746638 /NCGR_PEP_ID=MMETSP0724-20121128/15253_1 /TAXON_ID=265536 /ORGANISM="Amphiprora sp., Strain CCMP467" /LENGTH=509 /DNA_ID=CAMNT_0008794421 /DNA_START=158 /DNA_END=1688 /DNA_ORIENTATION=+
MMLHSTTAAAARTRMRSSFQDVARGSLGSRRGLMNLTRRAVVTTTTLLPKSSNLTPLSTSFLSSRIRIPRSSSPLLLPQWAALSTPTTTLTDPNDDDATNRDDMARMTPATKQLADFILALADDDDDDGKTTSKAITLLESQAPTQQEQANALLLYLQREQQQQQQQQSNGLPESFCIGIAGAPGAGKSTLIEAFGKYLLGLEDEETSDNDNDTTTTETPMMIPHQLAVVCVDPSSVLQGGSILGDKTRMPTLSAAHDRVYVRPAPSSQGTLGGLAGQRTYDTLWLLRQVYDVVLLETVGLGQSEVEIAQCVDVVVLCVPPGGGDALQGVKKGILEVTDLVCVTKADGTLEAAARATAADYQGALQFTDSTARMMKQERNGSSDVSDADSEDCLAEINAAAEIRRKVVLTSSETGRGLPELWKALCSVRHHQLESGQWLDKQEAQHDYWMWKSFQTLVQNHVLKEYETREDHDDDDNIRSTAKPPARVAAARLLQKLVQGNRNLLPKQP